MDFVMRLPARSPAPLTGGDLRVLQKRLNATAADMQWHTGMSANKWSAVVNAGAGEIVPDRSLAIMARILRSYPTLKLLRDPPEIVTLRKILSPLLGRVPHLGDELPEARLGILFGRDRGAGRKWMKQDGLPTPVIQHLATMWVTAARRGEGFLRKVLISSLDDAVPIRGRDLRALKLELGASTADMLWQTGVSPNRWSLLVNAGEDQVVPDRALRIMARLLRADDTLKLFPDPPVMSELYLSLVRRLPEIPGFEKGLYEAQLGLLLGRDRGSGYKWMRTGEIPNPVVQHLAVMVMNAMSREGDLLRDVVLPSIQDEAASLGLGSILEAGRWPR